MVTFRAAALLAVAVIVLASPAASGQSPPTACETRRISASMAIGDLDSALAHVNRCLAVESQELARLKRQQTGSSSQFVDPTALAALNVGALLIARIEILAMKQDWTAADTAVAEAERFDFANPKAGMRWSISGARLHMAKAFLLERRGNLTGAKAMYEAILADLVRDGWAASQGSLLYGRLATLAQQRGDDAAVEKYAAASGEDPAAEIAWAAVLSRMGDQQKARQRCALAKKHLQDAGNRQKWTLPLFYAELPRARNAC